MFNRTGRLIESLEYASSSTRALSIEKIGSFCLSSTFFFRKIHISMPLFLVSVKIKFLLWLFWSNICLHSLFSQKVLSGWAGCIVTSRRSLVLRAYCPNIYTVPNLPPGHWNPFGRGSLTLAWLLSSNLKAGLLQHQNDFEFRNIPNIM